MKTRFPGFAPIRAWWFVLLAFPALLLAAEADLAALRAKAEKGNAVAQYNLGLAYSAGEVVPKDAIEAYVWLRLATENGATGKALGLLMGEMSPSELAAGKLRLDERRRAIASLTSGDRDSPPASATPATVTPAPALVAAVPAVDSSTVLEQALAVLREDKAKLSQEITLVRKELESTKAAAAEDHGKLDATVFDQTQKLATLSAELEAARKDLAAVQSAGAESGSLQEQVTKLTQQLAAAQADQGRGNKLSAELDAARKDLASTEKANADSTVRLQKLAEEQNGINRQLGEAQATIERLKRENAELQAERTSLTARLAQPPPAAASPAPTVAPASAGSADDVARLRNDLARAEQTVEMTVRSFALMRQENERLKAQLEQAGAEHPAPASKVTVP
jgi:predicted ribosome quality control (RQC) complex YloA/Tae2 family protein